MSQTLRVKVKNRWYTVEVESLSDRPIRTLVDGEPVDVDIELVAPAVAGETTQPVPQEPETRTVEQPAFGVVRPPTAIKKFHAPMPGVIISVSVKEGAQVIIGDEICVLEAMKMRQSLRADWSGIVKAMHVIPGQQVMDGSLIAELE